MDEIKKRFYERLDALKAEHGLPSEIRLAVYEDDESLSYFRPGEPWESNAAHTACIRSLAASAAAKYGVKIELITINTSQNTGGGSPNSRPPTRRKCAQST